MDDTSTISEDAAHAEMRQRLLGSALAILQEKGAAALTVRNITEGAGCSTTGIYTYFGGKHGLIEAIYLDGFRSFDETLGPAYQALDTGEAGRLYREWALANPMHYLVMFGRAVPDFEPSEAARERAMQSFSMLVEAVGRAGIDDPEPAAYHLYATVHGYVMLELVGMGELVSGDLADYYEAGIFRAIGGINQR